MSVSNGRILIKSEKSKFIHIPTVLLRFLFFFNFLFSNPEEFKNTLISIAADKKRMKELYGDMEGVAKNLGNTSGMSEYYLYICNKLINSFLLLHNNSDRKYFLQPRRLEPQSTCPLWRHEDNKSCSGGM